jgi:hypothetical protein
MKSFFHVMILVNCLHILFVIYVEAAFVKMGLLNIIHTETFPTWSIFENWGFQNWLYILHLRYTKAIQVWVFVACSETVQPIFVILFNCGTYYYDRLDWDALVITLVVQRLLCIVSLLNTVVLLTGPVADLFPNGRRWTKWLMIMNIITILTSWSRVLLDKLASSQLVKKFLAFYGSWRFITTFTGACHLSLSWARSFQSIT